MKTTFKKLHLICIAICICCLGALPARAAMTTLIDKGQSTYSIVIPAATPDVKQNQAINLAANELQTALQKAGGARLPIISEDKFKANTPAIYLGETLAAKQAGLPLDEIKGWTALETVRDSNVFLVGQDGASKINADSVYKGTLRAVTSFLQRLGVRFLLPGQANGTFIPHLEHVEIAADLNELNHAPMVYIMGRSPQDDVYAVAHNYITSDSFKSFGGHSYYTAVPAAEYAKTHPEYFILKNGVRSAAGNHLCVSNAMVRELMLKQMEKYFDEGYESIELGQTDGYVPCDCDECHAISPDPGERLWIFHRELAAEMAKRRPGKKVVIISYGPTAQPPKTFHTFPGNVIIEMTHYAAKDFDEWKSYGNIPKMVYIYNWGSYQVAGYGPMRTPHYVAEQARLFRKNNVQNIYLCGGFESKGLEGPVFYTYGEVLNNPQLDENQLTREFCRDAYGKAAAPMTEFFETLYDRLERYGAVEFSASNTVKSPETSYTALYPEEVLQKLTQSLKTAQQLDTDPQVQARLRLVQREFDYVKTLANVFHAYHRYQAKPDWDSFGAVQEAVQARTDLINSWYDASGKKKDFDGFPNFLGSPADDKSNVLAGGRLGAILGAPLNWNFAELRENQFLPGVTKLKARQIDAVKMQPFTIDGKNDNPAWQNASQGKFVESNLRKLENGTTFRMGYDDQNLYIAFDCVRDQMDKFHPLSAGKDGFTYRIGSQDELEVSFSVGDNKYYRFFFNPAPESTFDGRYGFITDGLDPRYGKWDDDWDGKWNYAFNIDHANNRYTAEMQIPFSTLGIAPPKSGDTLQMQLRRLDFLYQSDLLGWAPGGAGDPVVSAWTGAGYKDYGTVTFR
jgi:hypothetical protein